MVLFLQTGDISAQSRVRVEPSLCFVFFPEVQCERGKDSSSSIGLKKHDLRPPEVKKVHDTGKKYDPKPEDDLNLLELREFH